MKKILFLLSAMLWVSSAQSQGTTNPFRTDREPENNNNRPNSGSTSSGCVEGNCTNGYGTYVWADGETYTGNWVNSKRSGAGRNEWPTGAIHKGLWRNDLRHGVGMAIDAAGEAVAGVWENDRRTQTLSFDRPNITSDGPNNNVVPVNPNTPASAPALSWTFPSQETSTSSVEQVTLKVCVKSAVPLTAVKIYVNDQLQVSDAARGYTIVSAECDFTVERAVNLNRGANRVKVEVTNSGGTAFTTVRNINYTPSEVAITDQKRLALIIGNSEYDSSPLRNPENDASSMAAELEALGFEVMLGTNASKDEMLVSIRDFGAKLKTHQGVGLFYFAGHGLQVQGRNYLVPVDANIQKEQDVELEAVDLQRVLGEMEFAGNNLNIVVLDACRNNPYASSFRSGGGSGLATTTAPQGTFIAFATAPGQVAADGTGSNGLYTQELIAAMREPGVKIEDVFKKVRMNVYNLSGKTQVPWENSSIFGDFYFKP